MLIRPGRSGRIGSAGRLRPAIVLPQGPTAALNLDARNGPVVDPAGGYDWVAIGGTPTLVPAVTLGMDYSASGATGWGAYPSMAASSNKVLKTTGFSINPAAFTIMLVVSAENAANQTTFVGAGAVGGVTIRTKPGVPGVLQLVREGQAVVAECVAQSVGNFNKVIWVVAFENSGGGSTAMWFNGAPVAMATGATGNSAFASTNLQVGATYSAPTLGQPSRHGQHKYAQSRVLNDEIALWQAAAKPDWGVA